MRKIPYISAVVAFFAPLVVSAHEVYVLSSHDIAVDLAAPRFSLLAVAQEHFIEFAFWAVLGFIVVALIFVISISRRIEKAICPTLMRWKKYAPGIARVTIGISLIAGAIFQASYGPELPLSTTYGALSPLATIALFATGLAITFNVVTRTAALVALLMFGISFFQRGSYMLTYASYIGEILVLLIGAHEGKKLSGVWGQITSTFAPYSFPILRVSFGVSLLYSSFYAKILHNDLALQVAQMPLAGHQFGLAHYMGFEPHFLVLGAAIVEMAIGIFFLLGIEIRFTSLFLLFWLTLSLLYFGESVWPHIVLIGIPVAFILHGYDRLSLEGRFFSKKEWEPVL